jgi:sugar/nucleoside kinase (ribokinase family)
MAKRDVIGLGNPLLDFTFEVEEGLLAEMGLKKGQMHLIDETKSREILASMEGYPVKTTPGGSTANTIAGVCALGGSAAFVGKIGDDPHGDMYEKKTKESGSPLPIPRHPTVMTGHAITFITPDGERTFATHLGAAVRLKKEDIDEQEIKDSRLLYVQGYQLEEPELKATIIHAMEIAKSHGIPIAADLSDPGLIERNIEPFKELMNNYIDIVFLNETEAKALTGKEEEEALHEISAVCSVAVVKLGEKGSLIKAEGKVHSVPVHKTDVTNTNGAGDMYAAGIVYALTNGIELSRGGRIASYAAAQVVASEGARVDRSLAEEISRID